MIFAVITAWLETIRSINAAPKPGEVRAAVIDTRMKWYALSLRACRLLRHIRHVSNMTCQEHKTSGIQSSATSPTEVHFSDWCHLLKGAGVFLANILAACLWLTDTISGYGRWPFFLLITFVLLLLGLILAIIGGLTVQGNHSTPPSELKG